jgi:hypothetical protein
MPKANHPQFFGKFIRKYVYHPLASSKGAILQMLDEKNPMVTDAGGRKYRFHQFLTDHIGVPALRMQLWQVTGILHSVSSKQAFRRSFKSAFPQAFDQLEFDLDDI